MDRDAVAAWLDSYERAWRTAGTDGLRELFTEDASYRMAPFEEPFRGLAAIGELWEREREGPDEPFEMHREIVAVEGDAAIVRLEVHYGRSGNQYRDLWVLRFDPDGRCREFEEWPFAPGHRYGGQGASGPGT